MTIQSLKRRTYLQSEEGQTLFTFDTLLSISTDDTVETTSHPIESGAKVTDHTRQSQSTISLSVGLGSHDIINPEQFDPLRAQRMHDELRALQARRNIIRLLTPRRSWETVILTKVGYSVDAPKTGLIFDLEFKDVLVVPQRYAQVPQSSLGQKSRRSGASKKNKGNQPAKKASDAEEKKAEDKGNTKAKDNSGKDLRSELYDMLPGT